MKSLKIECEGFYTSAKGNNVILELDNVDLEFITDIKIDKIIQEFGIEEVLDTLLEMDGDYVEELLMRKGYIKD